MAEPDYSKLDALFDGNEYDELYDQLIEIYKNGNEDNVELMWRLARSLYFRSVDDKKKYKNRLYEGQKFAMHGHELNPQHLDCLGYASVLTGSIAEISGNREKIQQGTLFKKLLDKALVINPDEFSSLHFSGRFAYSVANLSWFERTIASTFYGNLPHATMDEAIEKFAKVKKLRPHWIENILYYVKSMIAKDHKGLKEKIANELKEAVLMIPENGADQQALDELKTLARKYVN